LWGWLYSFVPPPASKGGGKGTPMLGCKHGMTRPSSQTPRWKTALQTDIVLSVISYLDENFSWRVVNTGQGQPMYANDICNSFNWNNFLFGGGGILFAEINERRRCGLLGLGRKGRSQRWLEMGE
jgi:hypothetical protein